MGKDPKQSNPNSFSAFLKKRAPIYLGLIGLFAIFVVPVLTEKNLENSLPSFDGMDQQAVDLLKSYKGENERGMTLLDVLSDQIASKHTDENIYENEGTQIELFVSNENQPICKISLHFESYKEKMEYVWNVNIDSGEVKAVSSDAKHVSDIVDYYD